MKLIPSILTYAILAIGIIACSKDSSVTIIEDIPEVVPTIIQADTAFSVGEQNINIDNAIVRFEKLITDTTSSTNDCIFSFVIETDDHLSLIVFVDYDNAVTDGLIEGTYRANTVFAYSTDYLQSIQEWNQNGANPNTKPQFNFAEDQVPYDDHFLNIDIEYITEGQDMITEQYFSRFGVPIENPNTNEPQFIQYIRDACIITLSGNVTSPAGENIEMSGIIETEYHRQI